MWRVKTRSSAGVVRAVDQTERADFAATWVVRASSRPSAGISAGAERDGSGLDEGSGRLEQIDAARGRARRCPGRQTQVGEESRNHRGIFDGGIVPFTGTMIFRAPPQFGQCSRSISKTRKSQARPAQARGRRLRMGMIG